MGYFATCSRSALDEGLLDYWTREQIKLCLTLWSPIQLLIVVESERILYKPVNTTLSST